MRYSSERYRSCCTKEIAVLSGKGGTGKTTIVGSFAALARDKVLVDCDVDAADLDLLLHPTIREKSELWNGRAARIDPDKCIQCGLCQTVCRLHAVTEHRVDRVSCEGCGLCSHVCPVGAIAMEDSLSGHWFVSETRYGPLVHARLGIARENSGKLVAEVRKRAKQIATEQGLEYIINDGPPGIGCPVISSLSGASLALLVTEPTLSGMHDLERVVGVCRHFGVPAIVCINKFDINEQNAHEIERYCSIEHMAVAGKIPFDSVVSEAMVHGSLMVEYSDGQVSREIRKLWDAIRIALESDWRS